MSKATRLKEDLTGTDERDLFRTPPDTKKRKEKREIGQEFKEEKEDSPLNRFAVNDGEPTPHSGMASNDLELERLRMAYEIEMAQIQLRIEEARARTAALNASNPNLILSLIQKDKVSE